MAAALLSEHWKCGGDTMEYAPDVDVDHSIPFIDLQFIEGRQWHQTGVADQYIESTEAILSRLDKRFQVSPLRDVDRMKFCLVPVPANVGNDSLEPSGTTRAENDLGPRRGKQSSSRFTDSAGCSRDRDDLSVYIRHLSPFRESTDISN
jgi:hypothetical protein